MQYTTELLEETLRTQGDMADHIEHLKMQLAEANAQVSKYSGGNPDQDDPESEVLLTPRPSTDAQRERSRKENRVAPAVPPPSDSDESECEGAAARRSPPS